jgi:hypothetical protein
MRAEVAPPEQQQLRSSCVTHYSISNDLSVMFSFIHPPLMSLFLLHILSIPSPSPSICSSVSFTTSLLFLFQLLHLDSYDVTNSNSEDHSSVVSHGFLQKGTGLMQLCDMPT